jgi:uncharacterized protein (TIGR00730 family)
MRICVFCGSSPGTRPDYVSAARAVGELFAQNRVGLVTGGGSTGLMGALANAALAGGGEVIGVIPQSLWAREVGHTGLTDLRVVGSMHERKALMSELSDAFLALPGGLGTLEELFEIWTWGQLGLHAKPFGLLNVAGYYDPLINFLDHTVTERFVNPVHRSMLISDDDPARLIARIRSYVPPPSEGKWIDRSST